MFYVYFKCSIKHQIDVAVDFLFIINGWLTTISAFLLILQI